MARSVWKGAISFGLVNIPVELYTAETHEKLHFRMLDRRDLAPIKYKLVNSVTQEEISRKEVVKGYEIEEGEFVIMEPEDFERANMKATHTIDIQLFTSKNQIDPIYFYRPYYVLPTEKGIKSYALFRETLKGTAKVAIAKIVMQAREHLAAVLVRDNIIVLELLRFGSEIKDKEQFKVPTQKLENLGIRPAEVRMAEQLVNQMEEDFDPYQYSDQYQEDLKQFIKDKLRSGETGRAPLPRELPEELGGDVIDFMDVLKESIRRAEKKRDSTEREARTARKTTRGKRGA